MKRSPPHTQVVLAALATFALGAGAGAQPPGSGEHEPREPDAPHARQPGAAPRAGEQESRERVEENLTNRLNAIKREQEQLQRALDALRAGRPLSEVREAMPPMRRPGAGNAGAGPGRERRDGGGAGFRAPPMHDPFAPLDDALGRAARGGERPDADPPADITDEEGATIREFLAAAMPPVHQQLTDLEEINPEAARRRLIQSLPRVRPAIRLKQEDPELYALVLRALKLRWEAMRDARWIAEQNAGAGDAPAQKDRRTRLIATLDEAVDVNEQIRTKTSAYLLRDRAAALDAMAEFMIERERVRSRFGDDGAGGPDRRGPRDGEGMRRRDRRPRIEGEEPPRPAHEDEPPPAGEPEEPDGEMDVR